MKSKMFLKIVFGLVLLVTPASLFAQDSDKVVILSPRVGARIDAAERERFHLFEQIKDFGGAAVFQTPQKSYYAKVVLIGADGKARDTTVQYQESYLLTLAEQIDHFEDLEKGIYRMGQQPETLKVVGPQAEVVTKPPGQQFDLLPFALKTDETPFGIFPQLGVGVGISTSAVDLGGIAPAFDAVEEKYRKQGYTINHHSLNLDPPMQLRYSLTLRLSRSFTLLVDAGKSLQTEVDLKTVSASALYYFRVFEQRWFRPYAGVGIVFSHFSLEKKYGDRISPVRSFGDYDYLESISAEGGNTGFMLAAGTDLVPSPSGAISVYLNYIASSTAEATVSGIQHASVKFGGLVAGARLSIYF